MPEPISVKPMSAPVGCWTCKDRKVKCDRSLPGCLNCVRVRRRCLGYGMRLSWPRANDTRRAMYGHLPPRRKNSGGFTELYIIQTSFYDMEMHNYLADLSTGKIQEHLKVLPDLQLTPELSWKPYPIGGRETELIHYFASTASSSLTIFNQESASIRDLLIQMALSDDSLPSKALLFALLAVSSQYRDGLQSQAVQFKLSAISALAKSAKNGSLGTTDAAQHVATGMLLCSFEIQSCSETNGEWLWYIRGVKDIIKANHLEKRTKQKFIAEVLDWVSYHDVIAQFSILHWRQFSIETIFAKQLGIKNWEWMFRAKGSQMANRESLPHSILQFLSEIFNLLFQAFEQKISVESLVGSLQMLENRGSTFAHITDRGENFSTDVNANDTNMLKLYQMAVMIYLARVTESISGVVRNVQPIMDDAFVLLCQMRYCEHHFPLLILGHEAQTDQHRTVILDLIQKTEKNTYGRNLECITRSLKALWIQQDLVSDQEFVPKYMDMLNTIMGQVRFIPSLV